MRAETKAAIACIVGALLWFAPWLMPGKALLGTHPALFRPYEEAAVVTPTQLQAIKEAAHPLFTDKLLQHDPEVRFSASASGLLPPTWNPDVLGGLPHVAQGLASPLYPLMWIARVVPPPRCYAVIAALQTALAAWFAFLMVRAFGVGGAAAGVAALLFGASGWMAIHQEYFQLTAAATWLPLAIGATRRLLDRRGGLFALGIAVACGFLSGFPQIGFYCLLAPALLAGATLVDRLRRGAEKLGDAAKHAGRLGVAVALGLALASPQLLATAELVPLSTRQPWTPAQIDEQGLPAAALIGALLPDLFAPSQTQAGIEAEEAEAKREQRSPWTETLYARALLHTLAPNQRQNRFEITFALGPAALLLALLGLVRGRRGARAFFGLLLAVGLALSLRGPLLRVSAHLPGFNIGDPKRALLLVSTALCGAAALGVERILRDGRVRRLALRLAIAATLLLGGAAAVAALLTPELLRDWAAGPIAESVSNATKVVAVDDIAKALPDQLLLWQRRILTSELLFAALWFALVAVALGWLVRRSRSTNADQGATRPVAPYGALLLALALPLGSIWLDATSPIPTAGLDASPSIVRHFADHPARGRLLRICAPGEPLLRTPWPPKLPMRTGVRDAQGYVAAYLRPWRDLFEALAPGSTADVAVLPISDVKALERPLVDLLDVEYVIAALPPGALPPEIAGFEIEPVDQRDPPSMTTRDADYRLTLWHNREPFGRARLVRTVHLAAGDAEVIAALASPEMKPTEEAWLTKADAEPLLANADWIVGSPAGGSEARCFRPNADDGDAQSPNETVNTDTVELLATAPEELRFRVAGRGGLLVQSDCWYPGWTVRIDGQRTPLLRVDHALRGVLVPPGDHRIELRYVPLRLKYGLLIAPVALVALLLAAMKLGRASPRNTELGIVEVRDAKVESARVTSATLR